MEILSQQEYDAIFLSAKVATWSVLICLPISIFTAWLLARCTFRGQFILDALVHLPLVIPPVVVGYTLLLLLGTQGPIGRLIYDVTGITIAFTWKGAAVASAVMAFPLMVRAIRISLQSVNISLEQAAATLGASPLRVFFTITIPMILPGITAGTVLGFARSLGEFGATITFVSNIPGETQTLPLALFTQVQTPGGDFAALRLLIISVVIAFLALLASQFFSSKFSKRFED